MHCHAPENNVVIKWKLNVLKDMGVSELECADTCKGFCELRIVRNDVAQWEHVFIPLWSPYITHLGKWIGLTLYMWQFHPAFNTQVTEGKKIQQRFYILIWSVNCSWDMEDEIIFIGRPVWDMDRFFLMSLSIQSFEKCISKGLHKIFCMFLSAINLNVKGYFKCSLESQLIYR